MQKDDKSIRDYAGDSLPQTNTGDSQPSRRDFMKKVLMRSAFAAGAVALIPLTGGTASTGWADRTDHEDEYYHDIPPHEDHDDELHSDVDPHEDTPYEDNSGPHGDHGDHSDYSDGC